MARSKILRELYLITLKGEADPTEFKLERARVVSIGRTGNVKIHDPLVSIHHAKIYYDMEEFSYVVEDLGSANGTMVNGESIRGDARLVGAGTELRIGDTVLRLRSARHDLSWIRPVVLSVALVVALAVAIPLVGRLGCPATTPEPVLETPAPITLPDRGPVREIPVDARFLWEQGVGWPLQVVQVTTMKDEVSDLAWIADKGRNRVVVVSFDAERRWHMVGDLPGYGKVSEPSRMSPYPTYRVDGSGESWEYSLERGGYTLSRQDGLVVWYREELPKPPPDPTLPFTQSPPLGPIKVGRLALKGDRDQLALFLTNRNIQQPVHYIVCEGALDGIRPQVLTYEGTLQELSPACIADLKIDGSEKVLKPMAVALDAAGRAALIDDVTRYYAGDERGLFLPDKLRRGYVAPLSQEPGGYQPTVHLTVPSGFIPPPFSPYPGSNSFLRGTHAMLPDLHDGLAAKSGPQASTVRLPFPAEKGAVMELATRECEVLRVEERGQHSPGATFGCLGSEPFLRLFSTGCGADKLLLVVPYETGTWFDPERRVAVSLEVDGDRVRTGWLSWR